MIKMPNHTETVIKIQGKLKDIITLLEKHTLMEEGWDSPHLEFESIIPSPKTPEECPAEYLLTSKKDAEAHNLAWDESQPRYWFNWYKWQRENWGTKWDCYNCSIPTIESLTDEDISNQDLEVKADIEMVVHTAWTPAIPVYQKLQEMYPDLEIEVFYIDEGWFYAGFLDYDSEIYETDKLDVKNPNGIFYKVMQVIEGEGWQQRYLESQED